LALDKDNSIFTLERKLAAKTTLIQQYPNLKEARLFQTETDIVLEVTQEINGQLTRSVKNLSESDVVELRKEVTAALYQRNPNYNLDQSGRVELLTGTMLLSAGYYGWSIPAMLDANITAAGSMYFIIAGAGYFVPHSITKNSEVTKGAASLAIYGGSRGISHGIALSHILNDKPNFRTTLALGTVTSLVEMVTLYKYANRNELTAGQSEIIGTCGDIFTVWGGGLAYILDTFENDQQAATAIMLGSNTLGMATGNKIGKSGLYTRGDAYVLRAGWGLGAYAGIALSVVSDIEPDLGVAISIATSAIGMQMGNNTAKKYDFKTSEGIFTNLGMLGGGLVGFGIGLAINNDTPDLPILVSCLGSFAGYSAMVRTYREGYNKESTDTAIGINFNPYGAMALIQDNKEIDTSILNLSFNF